jgi:hypothetical protein
MITLEEIADDYLVIEIKRIEEESAPISWALKRHGPEEERFFPRLLNWNCSFLFLFLPPSLPSVQESSYPPQSIYLRFRCHQRVPYIEFHPNYSWYYIRAILMPKVIS